MLPSGVLSGGKQTLQSGEYKAQYNSLLCPLLYQVRCVSSSPISSLPLLLFLSPYFSLTLRVFDVEQELIMFAASLQGSYHYGRWT